MHSLLHRRGVAMLASFAVAAAFVSFGCGGSDSNKPDGPEPVPDFTLTDVNSHSPTHQQAVTFSTFSADKAVMLFFGEST